MRIVDNLKVCLKCDHEKSLDKFRKKQANVDGLNTWCRDCLRITEKRYRNKYAYRVKIYNKSPEGIYSRYKSGAKRRNIAFKLSFHEFMYFWRMPCTFCGCEIKTIGLDRSKGRFGPYEIGNVISCCEMCNKMKRHYDIVKFLDKCRLISQNFLKLNGGEVKW